MLAKVKIWLTCSCSQKFCNCSHAWILDSSCWDWLNRPSFAPVILFWMGYQPDYWHFHKSARCSPSVFSKVLAVRKTNLITPRARLKNKRSAKSYRGQSSCGSTRRANACRDHSVTLVHLVTGKYLQVTPSTFCSIETMLRKHITFLVKLNSPSLCNVNEWHRRKQKFKFPHANLSRINRPV